MHAHSYSHINTDHLHSCNFTMPGVQTPWAECSCDTRMHASIHTSLSLSHTFIDLCELQLQFHDAGRANAMGMGRVPLLTDFYGFNLGSLGEKGALYASPVTQDSLSMLVYRCVCVCLSDQVMVSGMLCVCCSV